MRIAVLVVAAISVGCATAVAATVSGFVRGADNGEALTYANVSVKGTSAGAVTNQKGYYVITGLAAGTYEVAFTYIGYRPETKTLTIQREGDVTLTVELQPQAVALEAVEVTADKEELTIEPSRISMQTRQLTTVPKIAEVDLFRAIQTLPGVSTASDFSAGLYVRGGSPDQNLILLDDMDVYNPSHLFGFFSTFNVDAVKTVELQKSGFPARYGGRLSSLLDVHNRDGNRKEFAGIVRSSIIATSATLEGPWRRGSWMLSGRHTYIEPLLRSFKIDLPYKFYDLHGKLNYDAGVNDRTAVSYYTGKDRLNWKRSGLDIILDWGNDTWSSQWTHLFSTRTFSHFVVGHSTFDSKADFAFQDFAFHTRNRIDDLSFKGDVTHAPSAAHMIEGGAEAKILDFSFRREAGEEDRLSFDYEGVYGAFYLQDTWKATPAWQLQGGLRLDSYSKGNYLRLGPRLSVRRTIHEQLTAHAAYGRYSQFLNLVAQEGASFADMWFPVDKTLAPGSADHYIVGVEMGPFERFDISLEAYYKPYRNMVAFSEEFTRSLITPDATVGELFDTGNGRAYGADLYLRNHTRKTDGWIGYSFGSTRRKIENYNFGRSYYPDFDRRHQIVAMQDLAVSGSIRANVALRYASGQPTTLAAGRYTVRDINGRTYDVVLDGEKNANRLPDYVRIDVGVYAKRHYRSWTIEPSFQIVNLLNRKNVYIRTYDLTKNPARFEDIHQLPFLPTLGVNVTF